MSVVLVVYDDDHLLGAYMSLGLVVVSPVALDGVEVEGGELLPGTILQRAFDLVARDDGANTGRRTGEDKVSFL